ncbi:proline racemase family protein [Neorhizobium galegae]|uniref:trans-3-hydroxy-L-proline dehydratase n=1 Tax=Neorhizobium galegae TaxID=399 RepID=UPI002106FD75|nr:trans-3-hydroxy-L-proline dehydratase [Neorhizobium galegae]MCQ1774391.1 proline racemase family protein [Neorhizobium galegae]MCQ1798951.1 proline racemase family protein [Neorhizobium galegae]
MGQIAWGKRVLHGGQSWFGGTPEDPRQAFPDHELTASLRDLSDVPVRWNSEVIGAVSLLDTAGACSRADLEGLDVLAQLLASSFLIEIQHGREVMNIEKMITTVEVHTGGEPFRIVTSGLPRFPGKSIVERRGWIEENLDEVRQALIYEPRGHADMYAGYLTEPVTAGADFGVIFVHNEGYSDHCGHGVIALATAAVELGWVRPAAPETRVGIDAPCGFIEAFVQWDGRSTGEVRFVNVPSFVYVANASVETRSFGRVEGDIAFGGAFYFYTDGRAHGLDIRPENVEQLIRFGAEVKAAANESYPVVHPEIPELNHIYGTIIDNAPRDPASTQANCCIFADRQVDRSPTGSGTAGRVALLHARGELPADGWLVNESIIGSVMRGRVLSEATVGVFRGVVPEISGSAFVYGQSSWFLDRDDPFRHGFLVR